MRNKIFQIVPPKNSTARRIVLQTLALHDLAWNSLGTILTDPLFLLATSSILLVIRKAYIQNKIATMVQEAEDRGISYYDINIGDDEDVHGPSSSSISDLAQLARSAGSAVQNIHPLNFFGRREQEFQRRYRQKRHREQLLPMHRVVAYVLLTLFMIPMTRDWIINLVGAAICHAEKISKRFSIDKVLCKDDFINSLNLLKEGRDVRRLLDGKWLPNEELTETVRQESLKIGNESVGGELLALARRLNTKYGHAHKNGRHRDQDNQSPLSMEHWLNVIFKMASEIYNTRRDTMLTTLTNMAEWVSRLLNNVPSSPSDYVLNTVTTLGLLGLKDDTQRADILQHAHVVFRLGHSATESQIKDELKKAATHSKNLQKIKKIPVDKDPQWVRCKLEERTAPNIQKLIREWVATLPPDYMKTLSGLHRLYEEKWKTLEDGKNTILIKYGEIVPWYYTYYLYITYNLERLNQILRTRSSDTDTKAEQFILLCLKNNTVSTYLPSGLAHLDKMDI